jgi:hypothetical protein
MIKSSLLTTVGLLAAFAASPAAAGVARAWVSGHGTDAAGCGSPANPCRSLQYVHDSIINAGGEIDILDPAGYGTITITKAISIVNDGVGTAGVQQSVAQGNAITINAGANDAVALRGLNIDGLGVAYNGIVFNSGASLSVVNCVARHFAQGQDTNTGNGILIQPTSGSMNFAISNTILSDNGWDGFAFYPPRGNASAHGVIDHVLSTDNQYGFIVTPYYSTGGTITVTISNSTAGNNSQAGIFVAGGGGTTNVSVTVDTDIMNNNSAGLAAFNSAVVYLTRSTIISNTSGAYNSTAPSNTLYSYGDNRINGNTTDFGGSALNTTYRLQ